MRSRGWAIARSPTARRSARSPSWGDGVRVGARSRVDRAVVLAGTEIGEDCELSDCIVAAGARIGDGARLSGGAMVGAGATIGAGNVLAHGIRVFPGAVLADGAVTFG